MGLKNMLRRYLGIVDAPIANGEVQKGSKPALYRAEAVARARAKGGQESARPFKAVNLHPVECTPAGMAMDSAEMPGYEWADSISISSAIAEGQAFLGYPLLAELAQRPEYRRISETIAGDMTSKWIRIKAKGEEDKSERIAGINDALLRFRVKDIFREAIEQDGFFGRGHIYIDVKGSDAPDETKSSIGNGKDAITKHKIAKGSIRALRTVEAVWCYPIDYDANDPLSPNWYSPSTWYVMGKQVHRSRLLTIVGREVPDLLKPSYSFGGLSLSQMARPYVDNWLETRQSVTDLISAFSVMVLKTNLADKMSSDPGGDEAINRAEFFNAVRDNRGLMMIDKELEDFDNVSAPISGLDKLQAQSQEQMASVSGIPLVKLLGVTPSGLNASSEGELQCYYDWIHSLQEKVCRAQLQTVIDLIQMNEFGDVDTDIAFEFEDLWQMTEKEKAEINNIEAQTDVLLVDAGVISVEESRQRLANDDDSQYQGLDVDDVPMLPDMDETLPEPSMEPQEAA
ncbi:DUF1073 domain-containing protein [Allorhizobium ampelinum]|uniref:DUF1073 domain-containing protein n=1 Tax=Allorhizobium ampelinum TaxID=3025782 RepID=UPI000B404D8F|nr:DUF1073 domain-containing protein [Allorhizobium ampelinum]NTA27410.1 DUF1073 domain-containing protein [Allorhizobium ampelinum]OVE94466.1 hypothetical protein B7W85_13015 [Allorhizobium ampelinum]